MYHQKLKFATIEQVKINKNLIRILQISVFVVASYVIYYEIVKNKEGLKFSKVLEDINSTQGYLILILVFLGQFLNWWLESLKFKKIISKTKPISSWDSLKSVYAGNAIGVFTPNKVGTFIGRALYLKNKNAVSIVSSTMLGNLAQLTTTALFGFIGFSLVILTETNLNFISDTFPMYALFISFVALLLLVSLFLYPSVLYKLTLKLPYVKRYGDRIKYFCTFTKKELFTVLLFSILRYSVFALQFYLLLKLLSFEVPASSIFAFICVLYMIVTFIPSPFMGNLGTREAVVLLLLANYNSTAEVLSASVVLWIINIAFPAVLGSLIFLFNSEAVTKEKE